MPEYIISDASCLILLTNIGKLDILQKVYGEIVTTPEVAAEYLLKLPDWISVVVPPNREIQGFLEKYVDRGEASAIALAIENKGSTIILDDYSARKIAEKLDLKITGTLGIVIKAKKANIIPSLKSFIEELRSVNYRISVGLINEALKEAGEIEDI